MDILAKERMLPLLISTGIACLFSSAAWAGVYELSRVDYFNKYETRREKNDAASRRSFSSDELWAVEMTDSAGHTFFQRPPEAVTDLLNDPDTSTGAKYLAWNQARIKQLEQAAALLEKISKDPSIKTQR
jgi:hypothetical protein